MIYDKIKVRKFPKGETKMLKLYPIPEGAKKCAHFALKINGQPVETYSCLVSAMPFNREWPGHQRPVDQAEEASFIYFDTDEVVNIELDAWKDFSELKIRPLSKSIKAEVNGRNIKFSAGVGQYTVELDSHHNALHIFVNPIREYGVDINDKNVLYFGPGVHRPGPIELKSGQTLFVDGGAVVHASIRSEDCENLKIIGHGIIDYETFERHDPLIWSYDGLMNLVRCKNVTVDGVILKDSSWWTITAVNCENVLIDNAKAIGMWRYNADGFDMVNSSNVIIRNCFLRTFDDGIVFKGLKLVFSGKDAINFDDPKYKCDLKNVENHLVENCVVWCDWGRSLEIGAETCADEYVNIKYKNCDLIHNESVAMDIQNGDRANVHNVSYENINVEYSKYERRGKIQENDDQKYEPRKEFFPADLMFADMYVGRWSKDMIYGHTHDISYKNITVYIDEEVPMPMTQFKGGTPENWAEDITIENVVVNGKRITDLSEMNYKEHQYSRNITLK